MGQAKVRQMNGKDAKNSTDRTRAEEHLRKIAIREENAWLAGREALIKLANLSQEDKTHAAWHESAHAVIDEVLSSGVIYATIAPSAKDDVIGTGVLEIGSIGHVMQERDTLPINCRTRHLHTVAGLLAGGIATKRALGYAWGTESDEDQATHISVVDSRAARPGRAARSSRLTPFPGPAEFSHGEFPVTLIRNLQAI